MKPEDHRATYGQRMQRVQVYIDDHLGEPIRLELLASIANLSPFHFHRLFQAWVGETPADYLRRRRLEAAAMRLSAQPRAPVLDIALSVGFGSSEAFSRAFKVRYGQAPSTWRTMARRRSKMDHAAAMGSPDNEVSFTLETFMNEPVRMIELPTTELVGLSHQGPYGGPVVDFWRHKALPWMAKSGLVGRPLYGISRDDPEVTAEALRRYEACTPLLPHEKHLQIAPPAFRVTLSGGRYAMLSIKAAAGLVPTAWTCLLREWFPRTGLQMDARPCFERYAAPSADDSAGGVITAELFVPVTEISAAS